MNDAAIVLDSRDRIVEMNPAALRLFKKREDAVIGQPVATVFSVAPNLILYGHSQWPDPGIQ